MKKLFLFVFLFIFLVASIYWYILNYPASIGINFSIRFTQKVGYVFYKNLELLRLAPYNILTKQNNKYIHVFANNTLQQTNKVLNFSPLGIKYFSDYKHINYIANKGFNRVNFDFLINYSDKNFSEIWYAIQFVNITNYNLQNSSFTFKHTPTRCNGILYFTSGVCKVEFREDWKILFFKCPPSVNKITFTLQCLTP